MSHISRSNQLAEEYKEEIEKKMDLENNLTRILVEIE